MKKLALLCTCLMFLSGCSSLVFRDKAKETKSGISGITTEEKLKSIAKLNTEDHKNVFVNLAYYGELDQVAEFVIFYPKDLDQAATGDLVQKTLRIFTQSFDNTAIENLAVMIVANDIALSLENPDLPSPMIFVFTRGDFGAYKTLTTPEAKGEFLARRLLNVTIAEAEPSTSKAPQTSPAP